jgi:hypothetical protein
MSTPVYGHPNITYGNDDRKKRDYFLYEERGATLTYSGNIYALNFIVIAQVIFLNFGYIIGAIITTVAIVNLVLQVVLNAVETHYLDKQLYRQLNITLRAHYWVNHVSIILCLPFLIWTVVLMFERKNGAPI